MDKTLLEEFAAVSAVNWKEKLAKDLKGIGFEDLSIEDRNGNTIHPFYTVEDAQPGSAQATFSHTDWDICSRIVVEGDTVATNKKALYELNAGASGLCFYIKEVVDLTILLQDIQLQHIHTRFYLSESVYLPFYTAWQAYCTTNQLDTTITNIIYDPIAEALTKDSHVIDMEHWLSRQNETLYVDAGIYPNAGANTAYQLACTLAQCNEYLHGLEEAGKLSGLKKLDISIAVGTDFFEEIAKLRALRIVAENLFNAYDLSLEIHLHVETCDTYRSPFDAYSNLLRDTIAGMAAVMGGCNSLNIHPFQVATDLADRMSRNQQLIFKEESYLHQVADISTGSYYIDDLSNTLAEQAWSLFQDIEKAGGLLASKENVYTRIQEQAAAWIAEYQSGKRVLIGVNKYINDTDKPIRVAPRQHKGIVAINLSEHLI